MAKEFYSDNLQETAQDKLRADGGTDNDGDTVEPELVVLDPRGDLVLSNGPLKCLVSSSILSLSSGLFRVMLKADRFAEGSDKPCPDNPPTIALRDEDWEAFRLMCMILHYQEVGSLEDTEEVGRLADICNFYQTERALATRIEVWMMRIEFHQLGTASLRRLLWVAYVFGLQNAFEKVSGSLAVALEAEEIESWDGHPMPAKIKGWIHDDLHGVVLRLTSQVTYDIFILS